MMIVFSIISLCMNLASGVAIVIVAYEWHKLRKKFSDLCDDCRSHWALGKDDNHEQA